MLDASHYFRKGNLRLNEAASLESIFPIEPVRVHFTRLCFADPERPSEVFLEAFQMAIAEIKKLR
jgi:hypothetical protein